MRPNTLRRADAARQQQAVDDVLEGLEHLRKKNEASTSDMPPSPGVLRHYASSQQKNEYKHCRGHSAHAG